MTSKPASSSPLSNTALGDRLERIESIEEIRQLKVAYCPMVQKSWVQEDGAIRNPFYGSAMLSCGTFTR